MCSRGSTYGMKGDYDRAMTDFKQALNVDPQHSNIAYRARALATARRGVLLPRIGDYNHYFVYTGKTRAAVCARR